MYSTVSEFLELCESITPLGRSQIRECCENFSKYIDETENPKSHMDIFSECRFRIKKILKDDGIPIDSDIEGDLLAGRLIRLIAPVAYRKAQKSIKIIYLSQSGGK